MTYESHTATAYTTAIDIWSTGCVMAELILGAPMVGVLVTTVVFYGAHRLRTPMEPVIVICAAIALCRMSTVRRLIYRHVSS